MIVPRHSARNFSSIGPAARAYVPARSSLELCDFAHAVLNVFAALLFLFAWGSVQHAATLPQPRGLIGCL